MKDDITFKEALKLVDSLEKEPERFGEVAELMEKSGGAKKMEKVASWFVTRPNTYQKRPRSQSRGQSLLYLPINHFHIVQQIPPQRAPLA